MATKDISDMQVVKAFDDYRSNYEGGFVLDILMKATGQPEKVCFRAMERAESKGLVDYGVSLRTGWLTEKGYDLLNSEVI